MFSNKSTKMPFLIHLPVLIYKNIPLQKVEFYNGKRRKNPKISDTRKFAVLTLKSEQDGFSLRVMHPKDAEGIANSVDPDQTAPLV